MSDQITRLLDQIDRLDKRATPGPWITGENDETGLKYFGTGYCDCCIPPIPSAGVILGETGRAEAEFIALARTALPTLAKALRAVMSVHKRKVLYKSNSGKTVTARCEHCYESWSQVDRPLMDGEADTFMWPCPTVQAITDALKGDDDAS